jgi:hypothetical protein
LRCRSRPTTTTSPSGYGVTEVGVLAVTLAMVWGLAPGATPSAGHVAKAHAAGLLLVLAYFGLLTVFGIDPVDREVAAALGARLRRRTSKEEGKHVASHR